MDAEPGDLPTGEGWLYEPKWDGFRCIAHRSPGCASLVSKSRKPLGRYFPEIAGEILRAIPEATVLDREIVSPRGFEDLQLRLHPATSRVARLSAESPCRYILFDLLALGGEDLTGRPLAERRAKLEALARSLVRSRILTLGAATRSLRTARVWLGRAGTDGVMAKRLGGPYTPGKRSMIKYKVWTSYDCVVGGLSWKGGQPEHLLLGLYDQEGLLHYVGRAPLGKHAREAGELLAPFLGGPGFTGRSPAIENRWASKGRMEIRALEPRFVAEVSSDHVTGNYMRHGARLLRWRPDKDPASCTLGLFERR